MKQIICLVSVTCGMVASLLLTSCNKIPAAVAPAIDIPTDAVERGAVCMEASVLADREGQITPQEVAVYGKGGGYMQIAALSSITDGKFSQEQFDRVAAAMDKAPKRVEMETKTNAKETLKRCWGLYPALTKPPLNVSALDANIVLGCLQFMDTFDSKALTDPMKQRGLKVVGETLGRMPQEAIIAERDRMVAKLIQNGPLSQTKHQCRDLLL